MVKALAPAMRYLLSVNPERLLGEMIALSLVAHVVVFGTFIFAPDVFGSQIPDAQIIEVDLTYDLPKGPGMGPKAPDRDQEAVRKSDPRKLQEIIDEAKQTITKDTVKVAKKKHVPTNKLAWKDRQRMRAIEK